MVCRQLPSDEWDRLAGTELDAVWARLDPDWATVLVVEADGQIVGCWALLTIRHVEGLWIHPAHRGKGRVAARLWAGMRRLVQQTGSDAVVTAAMSGDVEALLRHQGATPLPGSHWVLSMKEQASCQQRS